MDNIEIVKAYFAALDSTDMQKVDEYLSEQYQMVDFTSKPMTREERLSMLRLFKAAFPNLKHSLSNFRAEGRVVNVTVQLSGTHSAHLDLRSLGIGVVQRTQKFVIFPNGSYEFTVLDGKIITERDVSPVSPNRRMPGMLKAMGVNMAAM